MDSAFDFSDSTAIARVGAKAGEAGSVFRANVADLVRQGEGGVRVVDVGGYEDGSVAVVVQPSAVPQSSRCRV